MKMDIYSVCMHLERDYIHECKYLIQGFFTDYL